MHRDFPAGVAVGIIGTCLPELLQECIEISLPELLQECIRAFLLRAGLEAVKYSSDM